MIRAALLVLALPTAVQAQGLDSVYTSYDWAEDCQMLAQDVPPDEAGMGFQLVCPGPNGMHLMLTKGDARISMDYGSTPEFGPWESFAPFNSVHDTVEWRRQPLNGEMQPFATIHRWIVGSAQDDRALLIISTVATSPGAESCMVGFIDTTNTPDANALAREVADRYAPGFVCGNARVRGFGYVALETPVPRRVPSHHNTATGDHP
ncbi:hypothetical protein FDP25_15500 [Roseovarius sp. A21]|uniref:Uncharacterized protein n=1 Tax=Roseovarius bejariae TaxID=2576383 RepID=A0A844D0J9_9RHOB|nr:hypothetical protein [Roseovarius bejariae]MRU16846.1 hypothetical protein [Roseovarius bejariae]